MSGSNDPGTGRSRWQVKMSSVLFFLAYCIISSCQSMIVDSFGTNWLDVLMCVMWIPVGLSAFALGLAYHDEGL